MKNLMRLLVLIFMVFWGIASLGQRTEDIFKISADSISRIKILSYEGSLSQYKKDNLSPVIKGKVILERNTDDPSTILFIASSDTMELIYDGRFGFEVNHKTKTVNQINPLHLKRQLLMDLIPPDLLSNYYARKSLINKSHFSQDKVYWIISFRIGQKNDITKMWINKTSMLPEKIVRQKSPGIEAMINIKYLQINKNSIQKPGSQIVKYIESYTLLPIGDIGSLPGIDSRDSLVGKDAPEFILKTLSDSVIKLSDFKGKYVLLDFWESWCGPCRMSMPHLIELYRKYHDKGLEIIGVTKDNLMFARKMLNEKHVNYLNVIANDKVGQDYRVMDIPQYFLINREGKIVYASKDGFEQKIEEMIKMKLK